MCIGLTLGGQKEAVLSHKLHNPVDLMDSLARIEGFFNKLQEAGIAPLSIGGDHLVSLPILRTLMFIPVPQNDIEFLSHELSHE